jgi:hypothetical protein
MIKPVFVRLTGEDLLVLKGNAFDRTQITQISVHLQARGKEKRPADHNAESYDSRLRQVGDLSKSPAD